MPSEYSEALKWMYALGKRGICPGLERMRLLCSMCGNPERKLQVIHVAGTNGKGSTSAMIESIARQHGLRTGLYTSPHLHSLTERIRINGQTISREELCARIAALRRMLEQKSDLACSFFEAMTLVAFESFADHNLDLVVLEVGLGGRLDATNVIERPLACAIAHIDLDHTDRLGPDIVSIAREKAGIIKNGVPVVHAADAPEDQRGTTARDVIDAYALSHNAPSFALDREIQVKEEAEGLRINFGNFECVGITLGLQGSHQARNAALAAAAFKLGMEALGRPVVCASVRKGLRDVVWPGRLETISTHGPNGVKVLLDAAHNPDGARSLRAYLDTISAPSGKRILLFGAMADKDWRTMLEILHLCFDHIVCTQAPLARSESAFSLATFVNGIAEADIIKAFEKAKGFAGPSGEVVVTGSIFVVAKVRAWLLGIEEDPPIAL
ncbi:MAG: bifunctional folylpolyglutamate synthase/dihydrofolate synthase [Sandaracinaceae bacterium]|nr:bifunctional folylpolyglutamate synthase/dihydrofolate synthase [Sandaracinaceae bacterium]